MGKISRKRKLAYYPESDDDAAPIRGDENDPDERRKQSSSTPRRSYRLEYLMTIIVYVLFEQFMFHEWRIYDYYKQRHMDIGVFDKNNLPLTAHNYELYTL